ncbi:MAG: thiamine phosphate synthase [Dehalococcoidia bacterium]|nr:thiamine phosphate synthase [Dehalococcoidia bacterium]
MISLYVVVDRGIFECDAAYFASLKHLGSLASEHPGVVLQVRAKGLPETAKPSFVARARDALGDGVERAFLNGEARDAEAGGFGGVHWPEAAIPAAPIRGLVAGASVHSLAALERAEAAGAAFALFGPVFDAGSKRVAGVGLAALSAITRAASIPVLAIGGVTPRSVPSCVAAGAAGVAAVTGVLRSGDPPAAIAGYLRALRSCPPAFPRSLATNPEKDFA